MGKGHLITPEDDPDPDSYYAVGKLNGENLGRLFARNGGLEVVSTRIGWIVPDEDPRKSRWVETPDNHEYMRAMNLSHRDCEEIFSRAISSTLSPENVQQFGSKGGYHAVVYAVSNNGRRVFDLSCAQKVLGYTPQDDVEKFYGAS